MEQPKESKSPGFPATKRQNAVDVSPGVARTPSQSDPETSDLRGLGSVETLSMTLG